MSIASKLGLTGSGRAPWPAKLDPRLIVVAFSLVLLVALWASLLAALGDDRARAIETSKRENSHLAAAFDEHVTRTIRGADTILLSIKEDFEQHGSVDPIGHMATFITERDPYTMISMVDATGKQIAASYALTRPRNWFDSENFQHHLKSGTQDLYISRPRIGTTTGKWSIYLSRPLSRKDGTYAGNVTLALDISYFSRFYKQFDLGGEGIINLLGRDGILRARQSADGVTAGTDFSNGELFTRWLPASEHGTFESSGTIDGITRFLSYRALKDYPLIVVVGITEEHALRNFVTGRADRIRWATMVSVIIVLFAALMILHLSRIAAADRQLRLAASVFDSSSEGIMVTGPDHRIALVNPAFTRITGHAAQDVIGSSPCKLQSGDATPDTCEQMWDSVRASGHWRGEIRHATRNGDLQWLEVAVTAVRNDHGEVTHHHAIFTDVTQRKHAENQLERLNAELERRVMERTAALTQSNRELDLANKELEAFSYSVSHDLRAPLRSIIAHTEFALEDRTGALDSETCGHLARIRKASERMGRLIDDLLNLSKLARWELRPRETDMSAVAAETVSALVAAYPARRISISIQTGVKCKADRGLLSIALQNLIGNAWKFTMLKEHPRIEFGSEIRNADEVYFIRDNGAGFDMQYAHKLFGVFQRLHASNEFEGTGIGLSIVQRIIARHGGRIWAQATPGEGATFYFTLGASASQLTQAA